MLKKINVKEKLIKEEELKRIPENEVLTEVKLLLDSQEAMNKSALKAAKLDHHLQIAENVAEISLRQKEFVEKHGGLNPISLETIKKICIKYGLRFLPTEHYIGTIDSAVSVKVLELVRKLGNIESPSETISTFAMENMLGNNLFIMAPPDSFTLKRSESKRERIKRLRKEDPILFYRIPHTDSYYLVHSWGNDLSLWNYLKTLPYRNQVTESWFRLLLVPVKLFLVSLIISNILALIIIGCLLTILAVIYTIAGEEDSSAKDSVVYSENAWNSKNFFRTTPIQKIISWIF